MAAKEVHPEIKKIVEYRERHAGRFVSTTHTFPYKQFDEMLKLIKNRYKGFELSITIKNNEAKIIIPAWKK